MKTVINSHLSTRIVTDAAEIERLRWFQHHRYVEAGLLPRPDDTLPDDPSVARSTYFGVYDGDNVAATARIVSSGPMPMFTHHSFAPRFRDHLASSRSQVGEISGLAVAQSTPPYKALSLLSREFLRFGLNNPNASLLIASVERPLVRMLSQLLQVPLHIIGDEIAGYGRYSGACLPILIDTSECLRTFAAGNSRQSEFFMEDLVLDLTGAVQQPTLAS